MDENGFLTVGELREAMVGMSDKTRIVVRVVTEDGEGVDLTIGLAGAKAEAPHCADDDKEWLALCVSDAPIEEE